MVPEAQLLLLTAAPDQQAVLAPLRPSRAVLMTPRHQALWQARPGRCSRLSACIGSMPAASGRPGSRGIAAGVSVRAFEESAGLREGYDILSLSLDRQGEVYVSTLESKRVRVQCPAGAQHTLCLRCSALQELACCAPPQLHSPGLGTVMGGGQDAPRVCRECRLCWPAVVHSAEA